MAAFLSHVDPNPGQRVVLNDDKKSLQMVNHHVLNIDHLIDHHVLRAVPRNTD